MTYPNAFSVTEPVDCVWGDYGKWSACSKSCGGGEKTRSRAKATEKVNGGNECLGEATQTETCNTALCPVDCVWGVYGDWSACSKSCGIGEKTRSRPKATEASNGGQECQGEASETESCNEDACPGG